ncbi:hypothetical protein [Roseovarius sp. EL26]|uniref:hypothetical protein n=1 Tax=Roseovarius sp. EL26 TaxID=2126672 RepID=UPI0013C4E398|nr:hypothetical protein [Roseovarius sp. EL26]
MFELKRTVARTAFKDLLGQANHFLITILVGLEGVRSGKVELGEEFSTSWNPRDARRSAERSRHFALDLALVRAVDAFDTYMMLCRRHPCVFHSSKFEAGFDAAGQSTSKRLIVFDKYLPLANANDIPLAQTAIDWRNKRVHSLSNERIQRKLETQLVLDEERFLKNFRGLEIKEFLKRYKGNEAPSFKDAASVISLMHSLVEKFDRALLDGMDVERYTKDCLGQRLSESDHKTSEEALKHSCRQIWRPGPKKIEKVKRALRLIGVHSVKSVEVCQVPDAFVEALIEMSSAEAFEYLSDRGEVAE